MTEEELAKGSIGRLVVMAAQSMETEGEEEVMEEDGLCGKELASHSAAQPARAASMTLPERQLSAGGRPARPSSVFTVETMSKLVAGDVSRFSYRFPTTGDAKLKVTELMFESLFLLTVPLQLMALFIAEDKNMVRSLHELGTLLGPAETVRQELHRLALERIHTYLDRTAYIDSYRGPPFFKPSVMKKNKEMDMLATNCHIQRLKVTVTPTSDGQPKFIFYDTITHGAPVAHALGFKHGGLRRLLDERAALQQAAQQEMGDADCVPELQACLRDLNQMREEIDEILCCQNVSEEHRNEKIQKYNSNGRRDFLGDRWVRGVLLFSDVPVFPVSSSCYLHPLFFLCFQHTCRIAWNKSVSTACLKF